MKKLSHKSLLGQQGANMIERVFAEMGQVWRPTTVHDTGVDGLVEFRDPVTEQVLNRHIQVQSKATTGRWESESDGGFIFRVREDDLNYWLRGNLPVILIASRPSSDEAYWVSINRYFSDPKRVSAKKIEFRKDRDRFDNRCLVHLIDLAISGESGIYKPSLRKHEELVSNLLQVRSYPKTLYVAETPFRRRQELNDWLAERQIQGRREWILTNERIFSLLDLTQYPWSEVADRGTVEDFDTREWADSDDPDVRAQWVQLLNSCLRSKLGREGVWFKHDSRPPCFYFTLGREGKPRFYRYHSQQKETKRAVVMRLENKKTKDLMCYRHSAMDCRFRRFDESWYLEISPTYLYTSNGTDQYLFHGEQLSGIKRLARLPLFGGRGECNCLIS